MKFVIDAFGGDNAPNAVIDGCIAALNSFDDFSVILTGDEPTIVRLLDAHCGEFDRTRIEILDAPEVISCEEQPTSAIRIKKNSSIVKGLNAVKDANADCFISAGSSGAILAGATLIVKRIPGIKRPALAPVMPTLKGPIMLIDCGANVDCKPEYLHQFAIMGSAYMKGVFGIAQPRIGLINNGTEYGKGNELTKAAYSLLQSDGSISFSGSCEARDILTGEHEVLVCDGFVGNAILKSIEGTASCFFSMLKDELMEKRRTKLGAVICKPAFRALKKKLDYAEYGGAPLLGINGGIIKAHGSSNAKAIAAAIRQARNFCLGNVLPLIENAIGCGDTLLEE